MKCCTRCEVAKPFDQFSKATGKKGGRTNRCKQCAHDIYMSKRDVVIKQVQTYYALNKDKVLEYHKTRRTDPLLRSKELWKAAKRRALINSLDFDLNLYRIFLAVAHGLCEGSGMPFDLSAQSKTWYNPAAPSIDKIDPGKGYTDDNIRVVCNAYNLGKNQMSHEEYVAFCQRVVDFNVSGK